MRLTLEQASMMMTTATGDEEEGGGHTLIGHEAFDAVAHPVFIMMEGEMWTLYTLEEIERLIVPLVGPLTRKPFTYAHIEPIDLEGSAACRFHETLGLLLYRAVSEPNLIARIPALLDMRADPLFMHPLAKRTPLHAAAAHPTSCGPLETLLTLAFEDDAPLPIGHANIREPVHGNTPLHIVACSERMLSSTAIVRCMLMANDMLLFYLNAQGETPLTAAIMHCPLLLNGSRATLLDAFLYTPAHMAGLEEAGETQLVAVAEDAVHLHVAPLICAVERNCTRVVERLLKTFKAYPDCLGKGGRTPLHLAVIHGNASIVQMLLRARASTTLADIADGRNALHYAAMYDRRTILHALLAEDEEEGFPDRARRQTPLHLAVEHDALSTLELLRLHHLRDADGRTPLDLAIMRNKLPIVRRLLLLRPATADNNNNNRRKRQKRLAAHHIIREADEEGGDALHTAAVYARSAELIQLVGQKMGPARPDSAGVWPIELAIARAASTALLEPLLALHPSSSAKSLPFLLRRLIDVATSSSSAAALDIERAIHLIVAWCPESDVHGALELAARRAYDEDDIIVTTLLLLLRDDDVSTAALCLAALREEGCANNARALLVRLPSPTTSILRQLDEGLLLDAHLTRLLIATEPAFRMI